MRVNQGCDLEMNFVVNLYQVWAISEMDVGKQGYLQTIKIRTQVHKRSNGHSFRSNTNLLFLNEQNQSD